MKQLKLHAAHLGLLRVASLLVPTAQRAEWFQEWSSELWYVRRANKIPRKFSWSAEWRITAFCLGAFQDAAGLWREGRRSKEQPSGKPAQNSPALCLFWLCALLVVSAAIASYLPGIRSEHNAAQSPLRPGVILIQRGTGGVTGEPSISLAEYADWHSHRQQFFADLAFYRIERIHVSVPGIMKSEWVVAHASRNLDSVLGMPRGDSALATRSDFPQAILSEAAWRRYFRSDSAIVGQIFKVGKGAVQIAGIAPAVWWDIPGHPDLWLLESESRLEHRIDSVNGYVLARLSPAGRAQMIGDSVEITSATAGGDEIDLRGFAFTPPTSGPFWIYLFALFIAVLALPASTSVAKSEANFTSRPPSPRSRLIRWAFLGAKLILIALVAYFASVDIAYCSFPNYSPFAEFLQFVASFCFCLFGLRWAVVDQSQRCPVCLRKVTHPAQVGIASCTFLGWNGTEMFCAEGHTMLHVPSLPTSWFGSQRWTYLDTSWDFLFADSHPQW